MRKSSNPQTVSYILVSYNGGDYLFSCLKSIERQAGNKEIIVVDNASTDGTASRLIAYKNIKLIKLNSNVGVAGGWNIGSKLASGDIYIFITQDVVIDVGFQSEIEKTYVESNGVGVIGALLLYPGRRRIQHAGGILIRPRCTTKHVGYNEIYKKSKFSPYTILDQDYITGAVLACKSNVFIALNGFDIGYFPAYYEDVDFCFRAKKMGWRVVVNLKAVGCHKESLTFGVGSKRFLQMYTRNRYFFIFKNLDKSTIETKFVNGEVDWIHSLSSELQKDFLRWLTDVILPDLISAYIKQPDRVNAKYVKKTIMQIVNQAGREMK